MIKNVKEDDESEQSGEDVGSRGRGRQSPEEAAR